jgi:hypothetical protein
MCLPLLDAGTDEKEIGFGIASVFLICVMDFGVRSGKHIVTIIADGSGMATSSCCWFRLYVAQSFPECCPQVLHIVIMACARL